MSSLETCTDRLLLHKAIQDSHHARLEEQLLQLQRGHRAACMQLQLLLDAVQRRARECRELRESSAQLSQQLTQSRLRLHALQLASSEAANTHTHTSTSTHTSTHADTRTHADTPAMSVRAALEGCRDAWTGHAPRIVQLVCALQVRQHSVATATRALVVTLRDAEQVVRCVHHVDAVAAALARVCATQHARAAALCDVAEAEQQRLAHVCAPRVQRALRRAADALAATREQTACVARALCAHRAMHDKWLQWQDALRQRSRVVRDCFAVTRDALDRLVADDDHNNNDDDGDGGGGDGMRAARAAHAAATATLAQLRASVAAAQARQREVAAQRAAAIAALAAQERDVHTRAAAARDAATRDAAIVAHLASTSAVTTTRATATTGAMMTTHADVDGDNASVSLPALLDAAHVWCWLVALRARVRRGGQGLCARARARAVAARAARLRAARLSQLRDMACALCAEESLTRKALCADEQHAWQALQSRQRDEAAAATAAAAAAAATATPLRVQSTYKRARATPQSVRGAAAPETRPAPAASTHAADTQQHHDDNDDGDNDDYDDEVNGGNVDVVHTTLSPSPLPRRPVVLTRRTRHDAYDARQAVQPQPQHLPQHDDKRSNGLAALVKQTATATRRVTRVHGPLPSSTQRRRHATAGAATATTTVHAALSRALHVCAADSHATTTTANKHAQQPPPPHKPLRDVHVNTTSRGGAVAVTAAVTASARARGSGCSTVLGGRLYTPSPSPQPSPLASTATATRAHDAVALRDRVRRSGAALLSPSPSASPPPAAAQRRAQRAPVHIAAATVAAAAAKSRTAATAAAVAAGGRAVVTTGSNSSSGSSQTSEDIFADMYS